MTLLAIAQVAGEPHVIEVIDRMAESVYGEIGRQVLAPVDLMNHGAEVYRLRWTCGGWPHIRIRGVGVMAQHAHHGLIAIVAMHAQARMATVAVVNRDNGTPWNLHRTVDAKADDLVGT